MARSNTYTVKYRRKREGKTNYKTRLRLVAGGKPRLVVRKSLKNIMVQIIEFAPTGDRVLASANSRELRKAGWKGSLNSTPAAYLTGLLLASKKKVECVLDIGLNVSVKGSVLYAALKGAVDGGMSIPYSTQVLPSDARIRGEHIAAYAKKLKENKTAYEKQFSKYLKEGFDPESIPDHFDEIRKKLGGK